MSGIYLHIPFCTKACHYCDFHFSTSTKIKSNLLLAMQTELEQRANYLQGQEVNTIYFGGGTPSLLTSHELKSLLDTIRQHFKVSANAEVTLEANPDDFFKTTENPVEQWKAIGINRLSIGIQSFFDKHLEWMNRAHQANEAVKAVEMAQQGGLTNISIDLIYGIPGMTTEEWNTNIEKAIALNVPHISAYCLTVEEGTVLHKRVQERKEKMVPDDVVEREIINLQQQLGTAGFNRYEVSNFAKSGMESKHNSAYWSGSHYLGVGPSAHSFNGNSRQWNVSHNIVYTNAITTANEDYFELEDIDETAAYNEYVMTRLRTAKGINLSEVKATYFIDLEKDFKEELEHYKNNKLITHEDGSIKLTQKGMLFADIVAADLFLDTDED